MKKIFLNAPLSSLAEQRFNRQLQELITRRGFACYSPQEVIPPGTDTSPMDILNANTRAVDECDIILSVLDKPGFGVIFELAYGYAKNKEMVLLRTDKQDYLGKMIEGLWQTVVRDRKANSLDELEEVLRTL
jgi:nucleoside 2-deoxyribosyltransferase